MTSVQLVKPVSPWRMLPCGPVKHFYNENNRLIATIAMEPNSDGTFDVGVARCLPTDQIDRAMGRKLAQERLERFRKHRAALSSEKHREAAIARKEIQRRLAFRFANEAELIAFVTSNPFAKKSENGELIPYAEKHYWDLRKNSRSAKKTKRFAGQ